MVWPGNDDFDRTIPFPRPGQKYHDKSVKEKLNFNSLRRLKQGYHAMIDNPTKFPKLLQPLFSKNRAFTLGSDVPSYVNIPIDIQDSFRVHRRLFINICRENFLLGAVGAAALSVVTKHYVTPGFLRTRFDKRFLAATPIFARKGISSTLTGIAACWKLTWRAGVGGLGYDVFKRSRDEVHFNEKWLNAGISGGFWGFVFGIRSGFPVGWAAGCLGATVGMASELIMRQMVAAPLPEPEFLFVNPVVEVEPEDDE